MTPLILAILGPSGVGKSTTRARLHRLDQRFKVIRAWTTRTARESDIDRLYVSDDEFDRVYTPDAFLPVNAIYGARYATPKAPIRAALERGEFPLIDWPVELLGSLHEGFSGQTMSVYLRPPSIDELKRRLARDGRDPDGERLRRALQELAAFEAPNFAEKVDLALTTHRGGEARIAHDIYTPFTSRAELQHWPARRGAARIPLRVGGVGGCLERQED